MTSLKVKGKESVIQIRFEFLGLTKTVLKSFWFVFKNYNEFQGNFLVLTHFYFDFLIKEVQISLCKKDHTENNHVTVT